jgi:sigma-E factor negative regulatory protein RseA
MIEQISALTDDEIEVEAAAGLIAIVQSNQQLAEAWSQYHLIGDAMRGAVMLRPQFKQNLMQKIEQEATVLSPNAASVNWHNALKPSGKPHHPNGELKNKTKIPVPWSIAASFFAVMICGWLVIYQQQGASESAPPEVAQSIPVEYLMAHQATVPSGSAYYIQSVNYSE